MSEATRKVPVTVLTGHLGAGRTTLLNRILTGQHGRKYAVIVNEFGEIGIDNDLIVESDEEIHEMNNGCICCTVRGDLIGILHKLLRRPGRFDAIYGGNHRRGRSGAGGADLHDGRGGAREDRAGRGHHHGRRQSIFRCGWPDSQEAEDRSSTPTWCSSTKVDLVSAGEADQVQRQVAAINPYAACHRVQRAEIDLARILSIGAFDLQLRPSWRRGRAGRLRP